jgi:hypothetical protein
MRAGCKQTTDRHVGRLPASWEYDTDGLDPVRPSQQGLALPTGSDLGKTRFQIPPNTYAIFPSQLYAQGRTRGRQTDRGHPTPVQKGAFNGS